MWAPLRIQSWIRHRCLRFRNMWNGSWVLWGIKIILITPSTQWLFSLWFWRNIFLPFGPCFTLLDLSTWIWGIYLWIFKSIRFPFVHESICCLMLMLLFSWWLTGEGIILDASTAWCVSYLFSVIIFWLDCFAEIPRSRWRFSIVGVSPAWDWSLLKFI